MLENSICVDDDLLVGEILEQVIDLRKEEQEKVVEARTEDVVVEPDSEMQVLSRVTVKGVTAEIDDSIKPENIKLGATILGVAGNVAPDKPDQSKVVKPSVDKQVVRADTGYELESVEVEGVTSEIDGNIQAENIRYGVEILGVVGAMEQKEDLDAELTEQESLLTDLHNQVDNLPEIDLNSTTATESDVVEGKQFYNAQGELVVGGYKDMLQRLVDSKKSCDLLFQRFKEDLSWIKNLDTSAVTTMTGMFSYCENLTTIDVINFNTSQVTDMQDMFRNSSIIEIDISNFDMDNVYSCSSMFNSCTNLQKVTMNETHSTKLDSMGSLFAGCSNLTNVDMSKWHVAPIYMSALFNDCGNLESVDISNIDTRNSKDVSSYLFNRCSKLKNIKVGENFNTSKSTSFSYMFYLCSELETIPTLDLLSGTSFSAFINACYKLKNMTLLNIKKSLQIGSGTSWGHLLTNESLINTFKELWDLTGSTSQTLTLSTTSKENIANIYVKLVDVTDEMLASDPYASNKKPCVVCESTDEGAMTLTEFAISKNWAIA